MIMYAQAAHALTNLPAPMTPMIGRQAEIDALRRLLANDEVRMITVLAPGGMGKTLLAHEVARQELERFADGVYVITITASADSDHLASMLAQVMSSQLYPSAAMQREILDLLETQHLLLVLDNAEYAVEAVSFLSAILAHAPFVKILATSQISLNLYAETRFPLTGLAYADDSSDYSEAIELFIQRSKSVRHDFQLTPQSRPAVLEICHLTQGMPLALVLAASWSALLSPEEIARELKRGFDFLEADLIDVPERQRSIRAIFNYTWELMPPIEQQVLARLSVFRRGFTREAAQVVAHGDLRDLMSLVNTAVLQPSSHEGRLEVHELLRQYASEHLLQSGQVEVVNAAHSRYFLDYVRRLEPEIKGEGQLRALEALQADEDNIYCAWEWAVQHREFGSVSTALEGVFWYCMMRSRYPLFESIYQLTALITPSQTDDNVRLLIARARLRRWWMQRWREGSAASHPEIILELEALLMLFREYDSAQDMAMCTLMLGDAQRTLTDELERATTLYQAAAQSFTALGDDYYVAWAFHFYAKLISDTQGIGRGVEMRQQGLMLRRKHGDHIGASYSQYNLSTDLLLMGQLEACAQVTQEILTVSRATGEKSSLLMAENMLSLLAFLNGDFDKLRQHNAANHKLASNLKHELGLAWTNLIQGLLDYLDGSAESARETIAASEAGAAQAVVRYFVHLAHALIQVDEESVVLHLLSAMRHADTFAAFGAQVWCLPPLAAWESRHGQPTHAVELLALAQTQPQHLMGWLSAWLARTGLDVELERQLDAEVFASAYERGRTLNVQTVIQSFLAVNTSQKSGSSTIPVHVQEANQRLVEPLSERELEVLRYIGRGLSNRDIANELVVELSTVKKHLTHIYGKLDVGTRAQAMLRAQQLQLL